MSGCKCGNAGVPAGPGAPDAADMPSAAELADEAERCLRDHILALADVARARYGTLGAEQLHDFLVDPDCVRHPHRLAFEAGEMAPHQFAQPGPDPHGSERVLWMHPALQARPDLQPLAVAYLIPVINYGEETVGDDHCLTFAARLFGVSQDAVYRSICDMAAELGLDERVAGEA